MRKITDLLTLGDRIYVYVPKQNIRKIFLKQAEDEGFTFGDGVKPTKRKAYDEIYAIKNDLTISFVGYIGHIGFKQAGNADLVKIDFAQYLIGNEEYIIK